MSGDRMLRRGITLSERQWRDLKVGAARRDQTISEFVRDAVAFWIGGYGRTTDYSEVELHEISLVKDPPHPDYVAKVREVTDA